MVMKKLAKGDFLKADHVLAAIKSAGKATFYITSAPVLEKSEQYGHERYVVDGILRMSKDGKQGEEHRWSMNATSSDYLSEPDKLGNDETKWEGHDVELELVKQSVEGKMKNVIYPVGAVVEEEAE